MWLYVDKKWQEIKYEDFIKDETYINKSYYIGENKELMEEVLKQEYKGEIKKWR